MVGSEDGILFINGFHGHTPSSHDGASDQQDHRDQDHTATDDGRDKDKVERPEFSLLLSDRRRGWHRPRLGTGKWRLDLTGTILLDIC